MLRQFSRRQKPFGSVIDSRIVSRVSRFCSNRGTTRDDKYGNPTGAGREMDCSVSYSRGENHTGRYGIDVVDDDTWRVSTGLTYASWSLERCGSVIGSLCIDEGGDEADDRFVADEGDPDYDDDIEDMRVRGRLFYKIDRSSREFEEYKFDFHRKKSYSMIKDDDDDDASKKKETSSSVSSSKAQETKKRKNDHQENNRGERANPTIPVLGKGHGAAIRVEADDYSVGKKQRKPTFNQLTGPYHEPFCLDIFVSKGSVRACIVHRVTSKVVTVAHSISKDMMFDVGSAKGVKACAAVGKILAQRALADDIHDAIFTPTKADKLEGKLMIVLKAVIENGVNVKVKLKERSPKRVAGGNDMRKHFLSNADRCYDSA